MEPSHLSNGAISSIVSLVVVALVARRELRASTRVAGRLWIRPAIILVITACLAALAIYAAPDHLLLLAGWVAGGLVVGIATGYVLLRFTTISDADKPNAVIVRGSLWTVGVWLVVLLLRVGARLLFGGTSAASNIDAGVGTLAVVAAAAAVTASAYHRAIAMRAATRYGTN